MEGRRRKKPLLALLARQGFPNFQEQGVARITLFFFFPLVYKHYFHLWFLIALAAALKLSVLVEHVSCVEALGGEFSDKPRAEKSVLHVEAVCQKGFHSSGAGAQRLVRDPKRCWGLSLQENRHQGQLDQAQALQNESVMCCVSFPNIFISLRFYLCVGFFVSIRLFLFQEQKPNPEGKRDANPLVWGG